MTAPGYFITFEGIDRSGKSTQAKILAEALGDQALLVREPGGTYLSECIRSLLKDPQIEMGPRAEALLFAAARSDLVISRIRPALREGKIVIADRYIDSSLAYQGIGRSLGIEEVERINRWAARGQMPDLTILIEIDPARAAARGVEQDDRFEDEGLDFQLRVATAYDELATREPGRFVRIRGDQDVEDVAADVRAAVDALIAGFDPISAVKSEDALNDAGE